MKICSRSSIMPGSEYYDEIDRINHTVRNDEYLSRMKTRIRKMNAMGLNPDDTSDVELFLDMERAIEDHKSVSIDPNVQSVIDKYEERAKVGFEKYGTNTTRTDIDFMGWLTHLQEELMDATIYIERLKHEI